MVQNLILMRLKKQSQEKDNIIFLGAGYSSSIAGELKNFIEKMNNKSSLLKSLKFNYQLGKKTWFGTGGNCKLFRRSKFNKSINKHG